MKGEITLRLLESIKEASGNIEDTLVAFLSAGHGASYGKLAYVARKHRRKRLHRGKKRDEEEKLRQRYHMMVSYLKRQGLIEEKTQGNTGSLTVTRMGEQKQKELVERERSSLPNNEYGPLRDGTLLIVAFDIPEKERRKRDWLRAVLKRMGLTMIQKSLWIGKGKLPEEFIADLRRLHLVAYIEVFAVTKSGSLSHVM